LQVFLDCKGRGYIGCSNNPFGILGIFSYFYAHFFLSIIVLLFGLAREEAVNGGEDNRKLVVIQVTDYKYDE